MPAIGISRAIPFRRGGGGYSIVNPELETYISGLVTPLSDPQLEKLDTFLTTLKTGLSIANLSDAFDVMYILAGETEESSLKNIVSNAYHCTNVSATSFTALEGFTSDGVADYLNTGWKPKSHGVNFALNDCSYGVYSRSDIAEDGVSLGSRKASVDDRTFLQLRTAGGLASCTINTDATILHTVFSGYSKGMYINCRTASNATVFYKNKRPFLTNANASSDRPDYDLALLALNTAGTIALYSTKQLSIAFTGKAFTETQVGIITDACEAYMDSSNKGVIGEIALLNSAAYCWFNSPRAIYNAASNKTWIGIVHKPLSAYSQYILQLDNTTGALSEFKVGSVDEYDDHNEPSILVRTSDNKLFAAYSEHAGTLIRTRISTNALDGTAWASEVTVDPSGDSQYTYCNAFEASNGDIYIFFREKALLPAVHYYWNYIKSDDGGSTWSDDTRILDKHYVRCFQSPLDKDIIHFVCSAHPNTEEDPNTVSHIYFDCADNKVYKSDGTDVTASIPLVTANMTPIFSNANPEQQWVEDIIVDASGNPRVLMTYFPSYAVTPNLKFLYYSEWTGLAWTTPYQIHQAMNKNIGTETIVNTYPGLATFDRANPDRIFASKEVSTVMEIFELTRITANSFTSVAKTNGSDFDNWRPFTVNNSTYNVFWLKKIRYTSYLDDFEQELICKTL